LASWPRRVLDWLCAGRTDYRDFQARKRTRAYRANRSICLAVWTVAALLIWVCGGAACLLSIGLVATLVCLGILDPD
jgi:hypothetical protein